MRTRARVYQPMGTVPSLAILLALLAAMFGMALQLSGCASMEVIGKTTIEPTLEFGDSYHGGLHLYCDESDECVVSADCRGKTRPTKAHLAKVAEDHGCQFKNNPGLCIFGAPIEEACLGTFVCAKGTVAEVD